MRQLTISEMKRLDSRWFEKGTMKFFNTKIESQPNKDNIFITSERMELDQKKRFTLRKFNTETNKVNTLGEFQEFGTIEEARKARLMKGGF